jgi:methyl-accepting chemotaxis protein
MKMNKFDEAAAITKGKGARHVAELEKKLVELTDFASKKAAGFLENAKGIQKTSYILIFALAISTIIIASLITFLVTRSIARPLRLAAGVTEQIASGNLTVDVISEDRRDEVGVMLEAMDRMRENLRGQIGDIKEGINVLSTSSSEISASSAQLAASATETATAVSETTTTVEEVRQTVQLSNEKAKYVADTSQKAAQVSQTGKESTDEAIRGMAQIREQMDFVAESTVSLSEQSQAIGEIIAAVNDLAEQSNLLSVNASIEAAKAGEHGKGFAVVAQEVRSLAEQSRQATSQVKGILNDIQKAISATVMAAEQGGKAVDAGSNKTAEAGESIQALANAITEATQASTQIAASSHQQLVGTDQVASAMESIKQASTENMESTKQLETEAKNLGELGQKLKELVEKYRV